MALLALVEAAMRLGISLELLDWCVTKSPKKDGRTLQCKVVDDQRFFDEAEVAAFQKYLHSPWPRPPTGERPPIPSAIKNDIRAESHYGCAICGDMNGGEVAHIDAVSKTDNNGPDNLVLLCPNHHTFYDGAYHPNKNVTREVVLAAKEVKRHSRRRLMKVEANATKMLLGVLSLIKHLESKLTAPGTTKDEAAAYTSEVKWLVGQVPGTSTKLQELGAADQTGDDVTAALVGKAPHLAKLATGAMRTEAQVRTAAKSVVDVVEGALLDLDEKECPHCSGRGQIGLVGDLCRYCGGSCYVSTEAAESYSPDELDEVECPRCGGRGQTGLAGDLCAYCKGSCVVSRVRAEEYDEADIDEEECPRCSGKGTIGLIADVCPYCNGSCYVSRSEARNYDESQLDEVDCPHCCGRGQTGRVGDLCAYCHGSCVVSHAKAEAYSPDDIDEVACPRCAGQGTTGLVGDVCKLCRGACVVKRAIADAFDR